MGVGVPYTLVAINYLRLDISIEPGFRNGPKSSGRLRRKSLVPFYSGQFRPTRH